MLQCLQLSSSVLTTSMPLRTDVWSMRLSKSFRKLSRSIRPEAAADAFESAKLVHAQDYEGLKVYTPSSEPRTTDQDTTNELDRDTARITKVLEQVELILNDREAYRTLLSQRGEVAQALLDLLQTLCDRPDVDKMLRSKIATATIRLSKKSGFYPKCLALSNVERTGDHPVAIGGFGDIWMGLCAEQAVCVKTVKIYHDSDVPRLVKAFLKEAILWRQFNHPNVLPFLGLHFLDTSDQRISLISPWMENGNLHQYLRGNPHKLTKHVILAYDVACGLAYLHEKKVIHGDLKAVNILITVSGRAAIADFGLSRLMVSEALTLTATGSHVVEGTARWLAPECLMKMQPVSYESDIYAFGCVCYELFTGLLPFHHCVHDVSVIFDLMNGARPERPLHCPQLSDQIWVIMQECWSEEPFARPAASVLPERFVHANSGDINLASEWNDTLAPRFSNRQKPWHPELPPVGSEVDRFLDLLLPSSHPLHSYAFSSTKRKSYYPTTPKITGFRAVVKFDFEAEYSNELAVKMGDCITVFAHSNREWSVSTVGEYGSRLGLVPIAFVNIFNPSTGQIISDVDSLIDEGGLLAVKEWLQQIKPDNLDVYPARGGPKPESDHQSTVRTKYQSIPIDLESY
ncbi:kinase-like protein [Dendrothele bispora CBS 962.96]|uniref:mitogen-activated protein kinase kinase kinase n=1 Tax=Dendrothele bispora (strain CBS 962.96) TaxID=1314807 RepID=A0A4S8LW24_DENBC|nr:kinase-like protein [Dendrothele bispora CBS 962.96]